MKLSIYGQIKHYLLINDLKEIYRDWKQLYDSLLMFKLKGENYV